MKLYTRTGDEGQTGLSGGARLGKDEPRVAAYGDVDELNASLGWAASACDKPEWADQLHYLQDRLFVLGAELADPSGRAQTPSLGQQDTAQLEKWIDAADARLAPLKNFVLPGGCELAGRLHLARTVCRRAERSVVLLGRREQVSAVCVPFLNRLGDLLFAWARLANHRQGLPDVIWRPPDR